MGFRANETRELPMRTTLGLALACGLILAGCTHNTPLSADARFDAGAPAGEGLIVLGLRVEREPQGRNWVVGTYNINPVYSFHLGRIGPDGHLAAPISEVNVCDAGRLFFGGILSACDPKILQYRVLKVPAGRYVLTDFDYRANRVFRLTSFVDPDPVPFDPTAPRTLTIKPLPRAGDPIPHPERSFEVGAGEIVSIGEITFDASEIPVQLTLERDDARARFALRDYPGITGTPVFRPVFGRYP
jgi:hypothetical protein